MDFGLSYVNTTDEIGSVFVPTTKIGMPTDESKWILPSHCIIEYTADIVSETKAKNHYNFKS